MNFPYSPGNWATFPKQALRCGRYFNPRIAPLILFLVRIGAISHINTDT